MIRMLGAMVDASERARQLVGTLETRLAEVRSRAARLRKRPRVFFEEWDDPLIAGIGWVSELVEIAGGVDIFTDRRDQGAAKDRVVTAEDVVVREPDLIIGSWCGKKFRPERVATRALGRVGGDFGWWMGGQLQFQLLQQQAELGFGLGCQSGAPRA
jgi:iron complex transport system substrate-binding protein